MRRNVMTSPQTHEGGKAKHIPAIAQLRRTVLSCFLWEGEFYEDGESIASRISTLCNDVPLHELADLAVEARTVHNLRHVSLLLLVNLIRRGSTNSLVSNTIAQVLQRADEPAELLALYGKRPFASQMKKGIAKALPKFNEYNLAKWDRNNAAFKLRDVFRIVRPKPANAEQNDLWRRAAHGELKTPDTWEVALSGGADKCETFTRLLTTNQLGYMALLRNLRNMRDAGVDSNLINEAILNPRQRPDTPFRFVAAARAAPQFEPALDRALLSYLDLQPPLPGSTLVLVDVSGSMSSPLSRRSDLTRMDAACTLASIITGDRRVFSFSNNVVEVPPRLGMAGVDAIRRSQQHGGTYLGRAVTQLNQLPHDRIIVITDEQSHDTVPDPIAKHAYMINVASAQNGVGYGKWTHLDGFSEAVLKWIMAFEG